MAQELAQYYVQIIPSAKGMGDEIDQQLGGDSVGKSVGNKLVSNNGCICY